MKAPAWVNFSYRKTKSRDVDRLYWYCCNGKASWGNDDALVALMRETGTDRWRCWYRGAGTYGGIHNNLLCQGNTLKERKAYALAMWRMNGDPE